MISPFGKPQTTWIMTAGVVLTATPVALTHWEWAWVAPLLTLFLLAFFRDPQRAIPTTKGHVVSPADGRVSSIHTLEHYEPLGGPAVCVRVFLSVLDVHVNRAPMHGRVGSVTHKPGKHINAIKAESAEHNESVTIVLRHPVSGAALCAVRQVAGAIARRIVCSAREGVVLQRGQRYGMIKFGSTTEVYLPNPSRVKILVELKEYVYGGSTVLAVLADNSVESPG